MFSKGWANSAFSASAPLRFCSYSCEKTSSSFNQSVPQPLANAQHGKHHLLSDSNHASNGVKSVERPLQADSLPSHALLPWPQAQPSDVPLGCVAFLHLHNRGSENAWQLPSVGGMQGSFCVIRESTWAALKRCRRGLRHMRNILCALKWYRLLSWGSACAGGTFAAAAGSHVLSLPVSDARISATLSLSCPRPCRPISCQMHVWFK